MNHNIFDKLDQAGFGSNVHEVAAEGECRVLRLDDESGEGFMTMYRVFDGIYLMYNDFHLRTCRSEYSNAETVLCIDHCREGRIEHENNLGGRYYMEANDIRIDRRVHHEGKVELPLSHYHGMSMEKVIEAAKKACCHDFIMQLPEGYDTVIGEGGASLSGGEKQRISIARAIMKDAPIIVLDEATANVDPENEADLINAIDALTKEKTIIMIAHRLKTVRNADKILVIDKGSIAEQGTHSELMSREGIYRSFIESRREAASWRL